MGNFCKFILLVFIFISNVTFSISINSFTIPSPVFGGSNEHKGSLAAIVDVNGDRGADFIFISDDQSQLEILISQNKQVKIKEFTHFQTIVLNRKGATSVVPADFNGDTKLDLLVTFPNEASPDLIDVEIYWELSSVFRNTPSFKSNISLSDQPLLVEANGDGISDLFVVLANGTRQFWLGSDKPENNWTFLAREFTVSPDSQDNKIGNLYSPHSNAIVNLDGSEDAKLIITTKTPQNKLVFEEWKSTPHGLKKINKIDLPTDYQDWFVGQSSYCDFNGDGRIDLLLPLCKISNKKCQQSVILARINTKWSVVFMSGHIWNFVHDLQINNHLQPITLVIGDFNHDGKIDAVTTMRGDGNKAVVLLGGPCSDMWCRKSSTDVFEIGVIVGDEKSNSVLATISDVDDDGSLDVVVTDVDSDQGTHCVTRAYLNKLNVDHCFLNVMVLAEEKSKLFGFYSPLPGATVICRTTDTMGKAQTKAMAQLTQTAYNSLQPPYVDFGLGLLPNFVDSMEVQLPVPLLPRQFVQGEGYRDAKSNQSYFVYQKKWTMLIPSSQVLVLPLPQDQPSRWTNRILVTPSRYLLMTLIVFVSVCVCVVIGIASLHCIEMKSDKRERILQKHRFHFDAM